MPRKQHTYHYIYKTTCKVNGKYYVGMHSTSNLEDGYIGSGKRLWNSIRKHGRENHEIEILEWFPDRSSLKEREKQLVNESLLQDSMCMNLALGGEGGFRGEEAQKKWSSAGGKSGNEKMKILRSDSEWSQRVSNSISEGRKNVPNETYSGENNGFFGRSHDEEVKKRISISKKKQGNSQFGTGWINHPVLKKNKKVKNECIPNFLKEGWIRGRKKHAPVAEWLGGGLQNPLQRFEPVQVL